MLPPRPCLTAALGLALGASLACDKATGIPTDTPQASTSQKVPFDRESPAREVPSDNGQRQALGVTRLPEGTPITIRLVNPLSSASSHTGNSFDGILEEPIVVDGRTAVPRGVHCAGRVLVAKGAGRSQDPGYLRIALLNLTIDDKQIPLETSSLFVKGASHNKLVRMGVASSFMTVKNGEAGFGPERRLTFRLAQAVDLR